ncbi:MAG: hypothetical protein Q4G42_09265 [Neisseria sp.]|nr:hypothetical protein [Neisseria sp.]
MSLVGLLGLWTAGMVQAADLPKPEVCRNLISSSFKQYVYETICQRKEGISVKMADRFGNMGCQQVLADDEMQAIADGALQQAKAQIDKRTRDGDVDSAIDNFCGAGADEYNAVARFYGL